MGHEIIYTSARKGLGPGSAGYRIVAATDGIPPNLLNFLVKLTGYEYVFDAKSREAHANPAAFVHFNVQIGGKRQHILGRVANAPLDNSSRSNLIAHLVAFDGDEVNRFDSPALVLQGIKWVEDWPADREPERRRRNSIEIKPPLDRGLRPCNAWAQDTGDAGWGGVLAEALADGRYRQAAVLISKDMLLQDNTPGLRYLNLIEESLQLLPHDERWNVGFSTYYTGNLPRGIRCDWQFVVAGTQFAERLRRDPNTLSIELSTTSRASGGKLVQLARDGKLPQPTSEADAPVRPAADHATGPDEPPPRRSPVAAPAADSEVFELSPADDARPPALRQERKQPGRKSKRPWYKLVSTNVLLSAVIVLLILVIAWLVFRPPGRLPVADDQPRSAEPSPDVAAANDSRPEPIPPAASRRESTPRGKTDDPPQTVSPVAPDTTSEVTKGDAPLPKQQESAPAAEPVLRQVDGEVSSPPARTSAGSEPPKPAPPLPFADIRDQRHRILDIPLPNRGPGQVSRYSLANVAIDDSAKITLKVIGDKQFIKDDLDIVQTANSWSLRRKGGKGAGLNRIPELGTFRILDNHLQFEWGEKAKGHDFGLRDCLLRLSAENPTDQVVCTLRSPDTIEPITLTTEELNEDLSTRLKDRAPIAPADAIMIELRWQGLDSLSSKAMFQALPLDFLSDLPPSGSSPRPQKCLHLMADETDKVPLAVVAAEFSRDGSGRLLKLAKFVRWKILDFQKLEWIMNDTPACQLEFTKDFIGDFNKAVSEVTQELNGAITSSRSIINTRESNLQGIQQQLKEAKGQVAANLQSQKSENERVIQAQEEWIAALENAIDENKARVDPAQEIDKAFDELISKVKLHVRMYRVFPDLVGDDADVAVLLETKGFDKAPQVMTRPVRGAAAPQPSASSPAPGF